MISISSTARAGATLGGARRVAAPVSSAAPPLGKAQVLPLSLSLPAATPLLVQSHQQQQGTARRGAALLLRAGGGGAGGSSPSTTLSRGAGVGGGTGAAGPQPIDEPSLTSDSYVAVGLATCFERDDAGKLSERLVIEPISASSLECMANGARTSFRYATGTTLGALMRAGASGPGGLAEALPEEFRGAALCQNWSRRLESAARTWLRPHAQDHLMDIAPLPAKAAGGGAGRPKARGGFNLSLDDKRILNLVNVVTDADNVKQDISIDVYGRAEAEAAALEEEGGVVAAVEGETGDAHERAEAARALANAPCDHMAPGSNRAAAAEDSSDDEDELDALLAA